MRKAPDYPVPALEKGLDIVEALAAEAVPQSLAELAARLKRSSSELFRMLNCLERRGYVAREVVSGKYALSLKLFALSHVHSVTEKLLEAARRPMQALTEKFQVSCHLSVLERGKLLVVAQQMSPEPVRISIEVGATFEAAKTASGRLLLAWGKSGDSETRAYGTNWTDRTRGKAGGKKSVDVEGRRKASADLERIFAQIRKSGVSTAESETIEGVRDLAVLVGKPEARVTAALAVTRLLRRGQKADEAGLLAGMRAAAEEITGRLGLGTALVREVEDEIAETRKGGGAEGKGVGRKAEDAATRAEAARRADLSKAAPSRRSPKRSAD